MTTMKQYQQQRLFPTNIATATTSAVRNLPLILLLFCLLLLQEYGFVASSFSISPLCQHSLLPAITSLRKKGQGTTGFGIIMATSKLQNHDSPNGTMASLDVMSSRKDWLTSCTTTFTTTTPLLLSLMVQLGMSPSLPANADNNHNMESSSSSSSPSLLLFSELLSQLQQAEQQLQRVPSLIDQRQWDSVRAVLITPPLSDCWVSNRKSLVQRYAQILGDVGGDEYAGLQVKEELEGHLRFLDMAVYNNNFNPITVEGTINASPTLIDSYYQDPINEYRASQTALQELIALSQSLQS
jgi:hypothetical protein